MRRVFSVFNVEFGVEIMQFPLDNRKNYISGCQDWTKNNDNIKKTRDNNIQMCIHNAKDRALKRWLQRLARVCVCVCVCVHAFVSQIQRPFTAPLMINTRPCNIMAIANFLNPVLLVSIVCKKKKKKPKSRGVFTVQCAVSGKLLYLGIVGF